MTDEIVIKKEALRNGLLQQFKREIYPGTFEITLLLYAHSFDDKVAEVTIATLVKKSGYSLGKVVECLRKLEQAKCIKRLNKGVRNKPQRYLLNTKI